MSNPVETTMTADYDPSTPVVLAPLHVGHRPAVEVQCGRAVPGFDSVDRMDVVTAAIKADPLSHLVDPADHLDVEAAIARVHEPTLVNFLENAWAGLEKPDDDIELVFADTFLHPGLEAPRAPSWEQGTAMHFGRFAFDTITGIGPDTWSAARGSVVSALTAAEHVVNGRPLALSLCRPPGHHVTASVFGGGCYLNNAAITAQWLRDQGIGRIAVVDVDFHHGNGTQAIFYNRADVVYASLHGDPSHHYPFHTGFADENGTGDGAGANINVPLGAKTDGRAYLDALHRALEKVDRLKPDVVIVSLGFDTYRHDPSGDAHLETPDYREVARTIGELGVPTVTLLEGGYWIPSLGENVTSWLDGARL